MRGIVRVSLLGAIAAGLVACGGGAKLGGGKEGAASALFTAASASTSNGSILDLTAQNIDIGIGTSVTVKCRFGGQVTIKGVLSVDSTNSSASVEQNATLVYDNCANTTYDNPQTPAVEKDNVVLNGTLDVAQKVDASAGAGHVQQTLEGKVQFGGAFDDFIDAQVTQSVEWAKLGTSGGSVSVTLEGTITTSSETYSYAKESVSFTAGVLVAEPKK
ncbi:MAG: hypothetical protein ACOZIN_21090 [Myxococcota bacterium]